MRDYLFIDNETGWEFFVECKSKDEAWQIVYEEFGQNCDISFEGIYSVAEAEAIGYDTF